MNDIGFKFDRPDMKVLGDMPNMGEGPVDVYPYIAPEFFELEREKVFRKTWLNVGRVDQIPNTGDYFTISIDVLGLWLVIVRGRDGMVRGFHNVCPHRGNALAIYPCGNARAFTCGFHGWAFDLDGSLRHLPGKEFFPEIDEGQYGMRPVATELWNGFIFIYPEEKPQTPLRSFLGALADDLENFPFGDFNHIARYSARVKVNWKTFIDAFHEAYHVMMVHRRSIPDLAPLPEVWLPTSMRFYGPHHSVSVWADLEHHKPAPSEALAWKYGMSFTPGEGLKLPGLNPSQDDHWWFDVNVFFPNFFVDVGPGWYFTYNFWPRAVDETDWEMNIYQMDAKSAGQKIAQEHTKVLLRDILYEDLSTLENTQKALASKTLKTLLPSRMELAVRHQYWTVNEWVNQE